MYSFLLMALISSAWATEAPKISETCVACHGPNGISANPLWPNIAGQKVDYLEKQLNDFRGGRRSDPLMTPVAKSLSDQDVKTLAEYYSLLSAR